MNTQQVTRSPLPMGDREIASTTSVVASRGTAPDQRKVDVGALENSQPGAESGSLVVATYHRPVGDFETRAIEIEAECFIDVDPTLRGRALAKSIEAQATLIIWTDATLEKLARLGFDADELVGATEAIDDAFDCYRARLAQQNGDQAFFDKRNAGRAA